MQRTNYGFRSIPSPSPQRKEEKEQRRPKTVTFSFYVRDGSTEEGLPGALFELINYKKTGRFLSRANPHGKVYFSMIVGQLYVLVQKSAPEGYIAAQDIFTVCLKDEGLFVNGKKTSSFVIYNHYRKSRYSVVYHADEESSQAHRLKFSYGDTHHVIHAKEANLQKEGHAFFGWKQLPCGDMHLPGDMINVRDDMHLYAQWTPLASSNHAGSLILSQEEQQ